MYGGLSCTFTAIIMHKKTHKIKFTYLVVVILFLLDSTLFPREYNRAGHNREKQEDSHHSLQDMKNKQRTIQILITHLHYF